MDSLEVLFGLTLPGQLGRIIVVRHCRKKFIIALAVIIDAWQPRCCRLNMHRCCLKCSSACGARHRQQPRCIEPRCNGRCRKRKRYGCWGHPRWCCRSTAGSLWLSLYTGLRGDLALDSRDYRRRGWRWGVAWCRCSTCARCARLVRLGRS